MVENNIVSGITGKIVATDVSSEEYLEKYAADFCVPEYWILDPIYTETRFYRLNEDDVYEAHQPDENGYYETPQLPGLRFHVPTLWSDPLPGFYQIAKTVEAMLK